MTAKRSNYVNDKINGSQTLVGCNLCYSRSPSGDRLRSRVFSAGSGQAAEIGSGKSKKCKSVKVWQV